MRLPSGSLSEMRASYLADLNFVLLGCLSYEERCLFVPTELSSNHAGSVHLVEVRDPSDAFPDYSAEAKRKIDLNRHTLDSKGIGGTCVRMDLLSTEDQLLDVIKECKPSKGVNTIVVDITSLPKRFFCLFVKRLVNSSNFANVLVTYTEPGTNGYSTKHLSEDPMTCDCLPGFVGPLPPKGSTLVVSIGFESLGVRSLLDSCRNKKRDLRTIMAFPCDERSMGRQWRTLMDVVSGRPEDVNLNNMAVIPAWDAERVYQILERWAGDADGMMLAPFGPKPHSLGIALFAMTSDSGLYYTQPKSYNPDYTRGHGNSWVYVVKWDGIPCFSRA